MLSNGFEKSWTTDRFFSEKLVFIYIGTKTKEKITSLPDKFIDNPIKCLHLAATKVKEKIRFRVRSV